MGDAIGDEFAASLVAVTSSAFSLEALSNYFHEHLEVVIADEVNRARKAESESGRTPAFARVVDAIRAGSHHEGLRSEDWEADVVIGGPPCQGFSPLNMKGTGLERRGLLRRNPAAPPEILVGLTAVAAQPLRGPPREISLSLASDVDDPQPRHLARRDQVPAGPSVGPPVEHP